MATMMMTAKSNTATNWLVRWPQLSKTAVHRKMYTRRDWEREARVLINRHPNRNGDCIQRESGYHEADLVEQILLHPPDKMNGCISRSVDAHRSSSVSAAAAAVALVNLHFVTTLIHDIRTCLCDRKMGQPTHWSSIRLRTVENGAGARQMSPLYL